ncbi:glutathione reductase, mitochondrial isoform X3 [Columba livia]|uniref:glutathione reductase, mitochondrial isoform X3 n=1 Tax=Columba livia TaxID=8932 RepID=UPI0031BB95A9
MAAAAYELLVLGGGSGGLAGARRAAELGARVALVEPLRLGGTCVNVGCVPKKVMWNTAVHAEFVHDHADYGFETAGVKFNWRTIKEKRDAYVRRLNEIYENNVKKAHIDIIRGYGKFTADPEPTIEVNGQKYTAPHILIATGGRPAVPSDCEIPGASLGMTSDGFFELEELPRRSVVVGAGYIAVEIAGILSTLGSKSSLLIRHDKKRPRHLRAWPGRGRRETLLDGADGRYLLHLVGLGVPAQVLRTFDSLISSNCTQELENTGVEVWKHTKVKAVTKSPQGLLDVTVTSAAPGRKPTEGTIRDVDCLLWAVGREPNTPGLGLDHVVFGVPMGLQSLTWDGAPSTSPHLGTRWPHGWFPAHVAGVTSHVPSWPLSLVTGRAGGCQGPRGGGRVPEHHQERGLRHWGRLRESPPHPRGHRGRQEAGTPALRGQGGVPAGLPQHPHRRLQPPAHRHCGPHRR